MCADEQWLDSCIFVCTCVRMYVYVHIYIYIYTYTHTHTHTHTFGDIHGQVEFSVAK